MANQKAQAVWNRRMRRLRGQVEEVDERDRLYLRLRGEELAQVESLVEREVGAFPIVRREREAGEPVLIVRFTGSLAKVLKPAAYAPREEGLQSRLIGVVVTVRYQVVPYAFRNEEGQKIEGINFRIRGLTIEQ